MAWTVPSGFRYYDQSASTVYPAGTSLNITPAEGDSLTGTSAAYTDIYYYYKGAHTSGPVASTDSTSFQISAGWNLSLYQHTGTATSYTILSSIGGANVVEANIQYSPSPITQITLASDSKIEYLAIAYTSNRITTITGTMPNTLKYFSVYKSNITSVPSLSNCTSWTYGYMAFAYSSIVSAPTLPSSIVNASSMFEKCASLTTATAIPTNCVYARGMYQDCISLGAAPSNNSTKLINGNDIFNGCSAMTTANSFQIKGASTLTTQRIFQGCSNMTTGPSSIANTTDLYSAFAGCSKLTSVPTIPSTVAMMNYMCDGCASLTTTPNLSNVNQVTTLIYTFNNCTSLTTIHSFPQQKSNDTLACTYTFARCTSLTTIPTLPDYISSMSYMFYGCTGLQPQNIYIPSGVSYLNYAFAEATNLRGIVTLDRTLGAITNAFNNVNGPIIITGDNNLTSNDISQMGINVYKELEITPANITTVKCGDTSGTLDDNGNYVHISIDFTTIALSGASLYVPKVYLGNDQQQPVVNWKLKNNVTGTTTTIANSTSVSATRILAGDLIANGTFDTYFDLGEDEVLNYKIVIATSAPNVYYKNSSTGAIATTTKYWNGIPGSAIFTSSTYIFDATADGKSFKVGGAVDETTEHGFIVGNRGLPLLADQYPSTFNGPVTVTSLLNLELFNYQVADTVDKELYDLILALGWGNDVIS